MSTARATTLRPATRSKLSPGDKFGEWTLDRIVTNASSARERTWFITCGCGYRAIRFENEVKTLHGKCCISCSHTRKAKP